MRKEGPNSTKMPLTGLQREVVAFVQQDGKDLVRVLPACADVQRCGALDHAESSAESKLAHRLFAC
jgi:hypothetical protein